MNLNEHIYQSRYRELPALINKMKLKVGLEVGVREGYHSYVLMRDTGLSHLTGIDIQPNPGRLSLLRHFIINGYYTDLTAASPGAANMFPDNFFDFIHIDADHTYEACKADLEGWWDKLKPGGLFSGDDFTPVTANGAEGEYGVIRAVTEFSDAKGTPFRITGVDSDNREHMMEYANEMGRRIDLMFRGQPFDWYDVPNWYLVKP